ncbi:MAG: nuclear transport factor 2 family protein [Nocardioides sp.]
MNLEATADRPFAERLRDATNSHDVEQLVACFAPDYVNETPVHPARGFVGRDQVRRNWEQIFAGVPDLRTELVRSCQDQRTVWAELEMSGTRRDGTPHLMRGVSIFELDDSGRAARVRFYLDPVDDSDVTVDEAVRRLTHHAGR